MHRVEYQAFHSYGFYTPFSVAYVLKSSTKRCCHRLNVAYHGKYMNDSDAPMKILMPWTLYMSDSDASMNWSCHRKYMNDSL